MNTTPFVRRPWYRRTDCVGLPFCRFGFALYSRTGDVVVDSCCRVYLRAGPRWAELAFSTAASYGRILVPRTGGVALATFFPAFGTALRRGGLSFLFINPSPVRRLCRKRTNCVGVTSCPFFGLRAGFQDWRSYCGLLFPCLAPAGTAVGGVCVFDRCFLRGRSSCQGLAVLLCLFHPAFGAALDCSRLSSTFVQHSLRPQNVVQEDLLC